MYDFQNLSFDDFERLCGDLLQVRLGCNLESFKVGRDQGIDLRYAPSSDQTIVVQCKRYAPGAFARLLRDVKKSELPKIEKLSPARYVLCTSCQLSPEQKDKLYDVLSAYCRSPEDILGPDEINRLIAENAEIERRHFKLWLGSTAILQRVIHAGVFAYSTHEVDSLRNEISRYVVHDGFFRALELLDETHHCIIVGIPGIGKTTAARLLLAHYIREDFEVVSVTHDIEDAWSVLDRASDAKVVVYYDDFLGQMTFSQKLGKNEDRRLLELVAHCRNSKSKRFILTTRDYIFDQALTAYEPLGRAHEDLRRSSVRLDDYGSVVRARLLANHLQFSKLGRETMRELVKTRSYERIIRHQNFLPRVIEQICGAKEVETLAPGAFIDRAIALLDDPAQVWRRPFLQLSSDARMLLYALASLDGEYEEGQLEQAWRSLCQQTGQRLGRLFAEVMREVEGSFTHSQRHASVSTATRKHGTIVKFINPSAREYVVADLVSEAHVLKGMFASAIVFKQLLFWEYARASLVPLEPTQLVAKFADAIALRAVELIDVAEPELASWMGHMRIMWKPPAKRLTRLHRLFEALERLRRSDLNTLLAWKLFGERLESFGEYLQSGDLTWAAEVLQVVLQVHGERGSVNGACGRLEIERWAAFPQDFSEVRYVWQAVGRAVDVDPAGARWETAIRTALVERTKELFAATPSEWSAEEISEAADELELIVSDLGDQLNVTLLLLRQREEEARRSPEEDGHTEMHLSSQYRPRSRSEIDADVDSIFEGLLEQLDALLGEEAISGDDDTGHPDGGP